VVLFVLFWHYKLIENFYPGDHLIDNRDTKEKRMIGELWEKQSEGRGLNVGEQIRKKIGEL